MQHDGDKLAIVTLVVLGYAFLSDDKLEERHPKQLSEVSLVNSRMVRLALAIESRSCSVVVLGKQTHSLESARGWVNVPCVSFGIRKMFSLAETEL